MTYDLKAFAGVLLLTDREYEVFKALGTGLSCAEIAEMPGRKVKVNTVRDLLCRARDRMNLKNRTALLILAVRYDCAGLKRQAIIQSQPQYSFIEAAEEVPSPVLPAFRNGHCLADRNG